MSTRPARRTIRLQVAIAGGDEPTVIQLLKSLLKSLGRRYNVRVDRVALDLDQGGGR